jgi:hypothetical protein
MLHYCKGWAGLEIDVADKGVECHCERPPSFVAATISAASHVNSDTTL